MCGIAGLVDCFGRLTPEVRSATVARMTARLAHRGPDGQAAWADEDCGVALGHRRLAIIDLSPAGRQPMVSHDGRLVITYNGEIYNYRSLRRELERTGVAFQGQSDSEVFLEAAATWGVGEAIRRANGIFALALWDRRERCLTLARDALGVKPLHWGIADGVVFFGSELKALREFEGWQPTLDLGAVASFLELGYVPGEQCIFQGIRKVPPGSIVTVDGSAKWSAERYFDVRRIWVAGASERHDDPGAGSVDALEDLLRTVVPEQMVADVPVGVFLSGGVDSSTIAAIAQRQASAPVHTFSIGFSGTDKDEAAHAGAVARHLGTDHHEFHVDGTRALQTIPRLTEIFDEPLADFAQIPTILLSEMTRRHVTVALSGDGGDELFAGYQWQWYRPGLSRICAETPMQVRRPVGAALGIVADVLGALGSSRCRERVRRFAGFLQDRTHDPVRHVVASRWASSENPTLNARPLSELYADGRLARELPDLLDRRQFMDLALYLPDDLLTKVDRASMANGLEVRVPLLDERVVRFAARLPVAAKRQGHATKWVLREVLYRYVPRALVDRPKMGFVPPVADWLRGECRDWAEDVLSLQRLAGEGILDAKRIRRRWLEHQSGLVDLSHALWAVLMLESWLATWSRGDGERPDVGTYRVA